MCRCPDPRQSNKGTIPRNYKPPKANLPNGIPLFPPLACETDTDAHSCATERYGMTEIGRQAMRWFSVLSTGIRTDTASGLWRPNDGAAAEVPWRPGRIRRVLRINFRRPSSRRQRPEPPGRRRRPYRSTLRPVLLTTVGVEIGAWPTMSAFVKMTGDRSRDGC